MLINPGDGHFSPIGGFNESNRMVLVMDVARFKYPAYWVSIDLLWESLHPKDESTNKSRGEIIIRFNLLGYIILTKGNPRYLKSAYSQLSINFISWPRLANILFQELPETLSNRKASASQVIETIIDLLPDEYSSIVGDRLGLFIPPYAERCPNNFHTLDEKLNSYLKGLDNLLAQIASTKLYHLVLNSFGMKKKLERIDSQVGNESDFFQIPKLLDALEIHNSPVPNSPRMIGSLRRSISNSHTSQVNDFVAFMTIFLFALFSLFPDDRIDDDALAELKLLVNDTQLPDPLLTEVRLIKDQILSFMEC